MSIGTWRHIEKAERHLRSPAVEEPGSFDVGTLEQTGAHMRAAELHIRLAELLSRLEAPHV